MSVKRRNAAKAIAPWLLAGVLAAAPAVLASVSAAEADEALEQELITRSEDVTDTLIGLSDAELEKYRESTDDVTASLVNAWESSLLELGALEGENGEPSVEVKNDKYTVTIPKKFEKASADFIYVYDKKMNQEASSINVNLPMGLTLGRALANTIMGILIVFLMLAFLSFIISRLKYIPDLVDKVTKKPAPAVKAPVPAASPAPAVIVQEEEAADDEELVAVITAAVAAALAAEGGSAAAADTQGFVVRSIRKSRRVR